MIDRFLIKITKSDIEHGSLEVNIVKQIMLRTTVVLLVGSFFSIFIYRVTGSFADMVIAMTIYNIGILPGYFVASWSLSRIGYFRSIKLSFLFEFLAYGLILLKYNEAIEFIYAFALFRGFASGIYFSTYNLFMLEEEDSNSRHSLLLLLGGMREIIGTALPILSGLLIVESGYQSSFALTMVLYLFGVLMPMSKSPMSSPDPIRWREMSLMLRLPGFPLYAAWVVFDATIVEIRILAFHLAPFLILFRNELNVGILAAVVSFTAGTLGIILRNSKGKRSRYAYIAAILFAPIYLYLGIAWDVVSITLKSLATPILGLFFSSKVENLEFSNMKYLLGKFVKDDGTEIQVVRESLLLVGRLIAAAIFLVLLSSGLDFELVSRYIIGGSALWPIAMLVTRQLLGKQLQKYAIN